MSKPMFFGQNLIPPKKEFGIVPDTYGTPFSTSGQTVYQTGNYPAIIQEPTAYMIGAGDTIENIRDARPETNIRLWGDSLEIISDPSREPINDFDSPRGVLPVGNMETHTDWQSFTDALSTDSVDYQVGSASVQLDAGALAFGMQANATTGLTPFDIRLTPVMYLWIKCVDRLFLPANGIQIGIYNGTASLTCKLKTDINGNTPILGQWQLYKADFRRPDIGTASTYDFTNIITIYINGDVSSYTGSTRFLFDGIRWVPNEFVFEYDFGRTFLLDGVNPQSDVEKDINLFEIITDSISVWVYRWNGSAYVQDHGSDAVSDGYYLNYDASPTATRKIKIFVNMINQDDFDGLGITIQTLLALTKEYEYETDFEHFPRRNTITKATENYLGAQKVDKRGDYFSCQIKAKGVVSQADLDFLTALDKRETPFWFWLNGNRPNTDFKTLSEAFDEKNVYFVINNSKKMNLNQAEGIGDTGKIIEGSTIELLESAYFKILNEYPAVIDFNF